MAKELISLFSKSPKLTAAGGAGLGWADHEELSRNGTHVSIAFAKFKEYAIKMELSNGWLRLI